MAERDWAGEREQLLQQAREEADHYLVLAREQAEVLKQEAHTQGLEEAEDTVRQEMSTHFASVLMSLQQALEELADVRMEALRAAEQDVVNLAFALARKIVHHDIRCNRQVILATLRQALAYLVDQDRVVIHVNPADLDQAQTLRQDLEQSSQSDAVLDIQPDETVDLGGCLIHSKFGTIDARIETQFDELMHYFEAGVDPEGGHL
jgi:flagellar assembly protein FliH